MHLFLFQVRASSRRKGSYITAANGGGENEPFPPKRAKIETLSYLLEHEVLAAVRSGLDASLCADPAMKSFKHEMIPVAVH